MASKGYKSVNSAWLLLMVINFILLILGTVLIWVQFLDKVLKAQNGIKWLLPSIQKEHIFIIMFEIVIFSVVVYFFIKLYWNLKTLINARLVAFIKNNHLEEWETVKGQKKLKNRIKIKYKIDNENNNFKVKIIFNGSKFDEFVKNKGREKLEDLFKKSVVGINQDFGFVEYRFPINEFKRLDTMVYERDRVVLGNDMVWDYDKAPHGLIAGMTGGGKTYFTNYLICQLLYSGAEFTFIDPKKSDIYIIGKNLGAVGVNEFEIKDLVENFRLEMENREKAISEIGITGATYRNLNLKPKFLIFDELSAFKAVAKKDIGDKVESALKSVIMKGRSSGCFIILITQQPNAKVISTEIRDQLGLKVGLGNLNTEIKNMLFGAGIELHRLDGVVKGVGYISFNGNEPYKFYAPNLGADFNFIKEIEKIKKENR